jgi:tetratricopeptide (TPR) repeat protein
MKKIFVPLFFAVAVFARLPAQEAPDAPQGGGEERYYESGLGDGDFARSLRAAMRGEDYYNAQQYEAALEAFDEAIALMPDRMYAAWVGRGNLYFYVYKEYGKTRNIDRLNFTAAYIERGDLYRKQRQYGLPWPIMTRRLPWAGPTCPWPTITGPAPIGKKPCALIPAILAHGTSLRRFGRRRIRTSRGRALPV